MQGFVEKNQCHERRLVTGALLSRTLWATLRQEVLRAPRETTEHTLGRSARNDLRPEENPYVAGLVSVRCFPMFRETRWRRRAHVRTYALEG